MEVIVQRNSIPESPGYTVSAYIGNYRSDLFVVIQIDYKYYFAVYDEINERYYVQLLNSQDVFNSTVSIPIKVIIYNFEKQNFEEVRAGFIILESIPYTTNFELLRLGLSSETDTRVWTGNLLVNEISGPYQNNKLVDVIDLAQPVYYLATPSDGNAQDSQVLSIKWEYQYNSEESVPFKNSKRSVVIENGVKKCKLECRFHTREDILEVTLFAFYKTKSPKVSRKTSTGNKKDVDKSDLIWSSKLTIEEQNKIIEISNRLSSDPNHLIAAMALETGGTFNPKLVNSLGYTGLIQIGSEAAKDINRRKGTNITTGKDGNLVKMSRLEQLKYVEYYLEPFKGKLNTLGDFYLAILFPVDCGKGNLPNHVVFDKAIKLDYDSKGNVIKNTKWLRQRAYAQNPAFHKEKPEQGKTYVWEITQEIEKWYKKGQAAIRDKNIDNQEAEEEDDNVDLEGTLPENDFENCKDGICSNYQDVWSNPTISSDNGGKNNNRYNHGSKRGHKGVDILSGPTYLDVHSLMCGTVEEIKDTFKRNEYREQSLGNIINIKSKDKNGKIVYILYCHLDEIYVKKGQVVKHGEKIALSGSTGNASDGNEPNGVPGRGIDKKFWHCHIEACASGAKLTSFYGKPRLQPEDYMKTKFDDKGNAI